MKKIEGQIFNDHRRKSKENSRFLSKYKEILIYKRGDKSNLNIYLTSNFISLRKGCNEKEINQINKKLY